MPWLENKHLEEKKKEQSQPKNGMFANTPVIPWKPYVSGNCGFLTLKILISTSVWFSSLCRSGKIEYKSGCKLQDMITIKQV